jgi:hypothetical protein
MRRIKVAYLLSLFVFLPRPVLAVPIVLDDVPSYAWYHGCGPTASASIMGYWDLHGYDNLFNASGLDNVKLTQNVKEHISSTAHNLKYDSKPDNSVLPTPPDTSLADFWHTSEGGLDYGWSYTSYMDNTHEDYASFMGYNFESKFFTRSWENLLIEVDSGNPLIAYVDSNGDSRSDHFIPIFGYDDRGDGGLWYASYNTWHESETLDWYLFNSPNTETRFGINSMAYIHPLDTGIGGLPISYIDFSIIPEPDPGPEPGPDPVNPVPEPSTMLLLGTGLIGLAGWGRKKFKKN